MQQPLTNISRRSILKSLGILSASVAVQPYLQLVNTAQNEIHFIGCGGGGCNALEYFYKKGIQANYTCITNPPRTHLPNTNTFTHMQPSIHKKEVDEAVDVDSISFCSDELNFLQENKFFVVLTGLGGFTGTMMNEIVIHKLTEANKNFISIASFPFSFEWKLRKGVALDSIYALHTCNRFTYFHLNDIQQQYGHLKVQAVLEKANEKMYEMYLEQSEKFYNNQNT